VIVDAIGVCENDKTDSRPLERKRSVPFDKLVMSVAMGDRDEDTLSSLAGRLASLNKQITDADRKEIQQAAQGKSLKDIVNGLLDAIDPDKKIDKAREIFKTEAPTEEQMGKASQELVKFACAPFDSPKFRNTIMDIKKRSEQVIDTISKDKVIFAGFDEQAKEKAQNIVDTFKRFVEENKDELTALQLIYGKPYSRRRLTYEEIKSLAEAIKKPPYELTPELVWQAYEQLDRAKVKGAGPQKLLTNLISLLHFVIGETDVLEPFPEVENRRFESWLAQQEQLGRKFTPEQRAWLQMIKEHIATSASIRLEDFELSPFYEKGGAVRANRLFEQQLDKLLEELNEVLVA
jgi:type I restriction enzyme R subunit